MENITSITHGRERESRWRRHRASLALAVSVASLIVPASAAAEPSGAPFAISPSPVGDLALSASRGGRVLATGANGTRSVLGRTGSLSPVQPFFGLGEDGDTAADPRLGQHLRVWAEYGGILAQLHGADGTPVAYPFYVYSRESRSDYPRCPRWHTARAAVSTSSPGKAGKEGPRARSTSGAWTSGVRSCPA